MSGSANEVIAIERAFPELRLPVGRRALRSSLKQVRTRTRTILGGGAEGSLCADEAYWPIGGRRRRR